MYEQLTALASTISGAAPDTRAPQPSRPRPNRGPRRGRGPFAEAVTVGGGEVATPPTDDGGPGIAVFPQAPDAMACALALAEQYRGRAGLYKGDTRRHGDTVDGPAVDAARSLHELSTGGIVLTARVAGLVSHLLAGAVVADRGPHRTAPGRLERAFEVWPPRARLADDAQAANLDWAWRLPASTVGRDDHLAALVAAWDAAGSEPGPLGLVALSGESGIGKTTLAAELAVRAYASGAQVLYGRWDEGRVADYAALAGALDRYAAQCPRGILAGDLAGHRDVVARLLPRLGNARTPLVGDPTTEQRRLAEALTAWLARMAARRPVLVVLDDVQWADAPSLDVLEQVVEALDARVLVVATLRVERDAADPLAPLGELARAPGLVHVPLGGLSPTNVEQLVGSTLGRPVADEEAGGVARLHDETAGNPLYLGAVLHHLGPDPVAALEELSDRLPAEVHDVIRWRLDALPAATVRALEVGAVAGGEARADLVAAVLGDDPDSVASALDVAREAGVAHDLVGGARGVGLSHGVVRRCLLDDLDPERTRRLHARLADELAARAAGRESEAMVVAHHYLEAGDDVEVALAWARRGAQEALRRSRNEAAVDLLSRAVAFHDRAGDDPTLAVYLRLELAAAHDRARDYTARDARYREAADRADALGDVELFVEAALGYGGRLPASTMPNRRARHLLEAARDRLPPDDQRNRALVLARLAQVQHNEASYERRRALADEAVAVARRLRIPGVLASALVARNLALDGPDDVRHGIETGREVRRLAERTHDVDLDLQGIRAMLPGLLATGAVDQAHKLAAEFGARAADVHPEHERIADMWVTLWAGLRGEWDELDARSAALEASLRRSGHPQVDVIAWGQRLPMRWLRGGMQHGRGLVDALYASQPDYHVSQALQALLDASAGDLDAVRRVRDEGKLRQLDALQPGFLWLPAVVATAVAAQALDDGPWADHVYDVLFPHGYRHCVMGYTAYLGHGRHHLGVLAATAGRLDSAADHLAAALDEHEAVGARPFAALSAHELSRVLARRDGPGDAERAGELTVRRDAAMAEFGLGGPAFGQPPP